MTDVTDSGILTTASDLLFTGGREGLLPGARCAHRRAALEDQSRRGDQQRPDLLPRRQQAVRLDRVRAVALGVRARRVGAYGAFTPLGNSKVTIYSSGLKAVTSVRDAFGDQKKSPFDTLCTVPPWILRSTVSPFLISTIVPPVVISPSSSRRSPRPRLRSRAPRPAPAVCGGRSPGDTQCRWTWRRRHARQPLCWHRRRPAVWPCGRLRSPRRGNMLPSGCY